MKNKKEIVVSNATKDRVEACKSYIERKYAKQIQEEREQMENWQHLFKTMDSLQMNSKEQDLIKKEILKKEAELQRKKRTKLVVEDFSPIAIIGRGAFGEVRLCRHVPTQQIVAVKKMKKNEMIFKNQIGHVTNERQVLESAKGNQWIVEMKCSFQDDKHLYLVMEYLPGGDLMTLLMKKDILTENETRFYMSELVQSVRSVHKLGFIHRDLKPDNILLDNLGHLKLSDFGLCKDADIHFDKHTIFSKQYSKKRTRREMAFSTVGTPDYIAPEVFMQLGYNETVDWWSVGIIMYEMLVGYPPFFSDDPTTTCQKIMKHQKYFQFPTEPKISSLAMDLISRLLTDAQNRAGYDEIMKHPWFCNLNFSRVRDMKAPNLPTIRSELDTSNFDKYEEEDPWISKTGKQNKKEMTFVGYTYKQDDFEDKHPLKKALEELELNKPSNARTTTRNSQSPFQSPNLNFKNILQTKQCQTQLIKTTVNQSPFTKQQTISPMPIGKNMKTSARLQTEQNESFHNNENANPNQQQAKNFIFQKIQQHQQQQQSTTSHSTSTQQQSTYQYKQPNFNQDLVKLIQKPKMDYELSRPLTLKSNIMSQLRTISPMTKRQQ